jgi:hypothetical protein
MRRNPFFPRKIARSLTDHKVWRPLMPRIRNVVAQLVRDRCVIVTRGTKVLSLEEMRAAQFESAAARCSANDQANTTALRKVSLNHFCTDGACTPLYV